MLHGFLLFEEHSTKWAKSTQKCSKQKEAKHISYFSDYRSNIKTFIQNIMRMF